MKKFWRVAQISAERSYAVTISTFCGQRAAQLLERAIERPRDRDDVFALLHDHDAADDFAFTIEIRDSAA